MWFFYSKSKIDWISSHDIVELEISCVRDRKWKGKVCEWVKGVKRNWKEIKRRNLEK